MLQYFRVRNYTSILDACLDLSFGEGKAPNGWRDYEMMPFLALPDDNGCRRVPVLALYGANAAGKTNILRAFSRFKQVICEGISAGYSPNRINRKYATTTFEVGVYLAGTQLRYSLEYDLAGIASEILERVKEGEVVFSCRAGVLDVGELPHGAYDQNRLADIFKIECSDGNGVQIKSFLYCLVKNYVGLSKIVAELGDVLMRGTEVYLHNDPLFSHALDKYIGRSDNQNFASAFAKIVAILRKFDFSVRNMDLDRRRIDRDSPGPVIVELIKQGVVSSIGDGALTVDRVTVYHQGIDGRLEPFDFMTEESEGTKIAASLIAICLWALENGTVVFFDELDRSLHPIILLELVHLFKRKTDNPNGAQLVFTLHDTSLLEDPVIRVSEIAVVNNNAYTGTTVTRLCDLDRGKDSPVRNVHNFRKQYMEGILSGVPHPIH